MKAKTVLIPAFVAAAMTSNGAMWSARYNEARDTEFRGVSITNAACWVSGDTYGTDGEPLSPNEDYTVALGRTIFTTDATSSSGSEDSITFTGGSLTFGNTGNEGRLRHYLSGDAVLDLDDGGKNSGAILHRGYIVGLFSSASASTISGKIRVTAPDAVPFQIGTAYPNLSYLFTGSFSSEPGTSLCVNNVNYTSSSRTRRENAAYAFTGSFADYKGRLTVDQASARFATDVFPGTLSLTNGTLSANGPESVFTVDTFISDAESAIEVSVSADPDSRTLVTNSLIVVTNRFQVNGSVKVSFDGDTYLSLSNATTRIPVLKVPASSMFERESFSVTRGRIDVETDDASGTKTIVAVITPTVISNTDDTTTESTAWTDGLVPHPGAIYSLVKAGADDRVAVPATSGDYDFPGDILTIGGGVTLEVLNSALHVNELRIFGIFMARADHTLSGRLVLADDYAYICAWNNAVLTISADIIGGEDTLIIMDGRHNSTGTRRGYTRLTGDNSRFSGRIIVAQDRDQETPGENLHQWLYVSDPSKLGAPRSSFCATALVLKCLAKLASEQSVTFSDLTRGIYVGDDGSGLGTRATDSCGTNSEGQMHVKEGDTMTILTQLTLNGRLHKYGPGTLALGGPLKFGPAASVSDEPYACSNFLAVAEGFVKPLSADSFNGMEMTFAADAGGIRLDIAPNDADLAEHGLRNIKAETPFIPPEGGRIPVSFDVPGDFLPSDKFKVGIATVSGSSDADAAAARNLFAVANPRIGSFHMFVDAKADAESNTVTVSAEFRKVGFVLTVK